MVVVPSVVEVSATPPQRSVVFFAERGEHQMAGMTELVARIHTGPPSSDGFAPLPSLTLTNR
ncbi:MAG TPA: hypothetical protein VM262_03855 [Acidimicrobiales bacterium]|nr:hypothetical protein [Acidimicrobiales bacterium]